MGGICDDKQCLCFALALWNEKDPTTLLETKREHAFEQLVREQVGGKQKEGK